MKPTTVPPRAGARSSSTSPLRVDTWFGWLTSATAPRAEALSAAQQRLAMQLMHLLTLTPPTLQAGFDQLWQHPAIRDEIAEVLTLTHANLDAAPTPLLGLGDIPLLAHARYSRAEVF